MMILTTMVVVTVEVNLAQLPAVLRGGAKHI